MIRKELAVFLILLFIGICVVPSTAFQEFKDKSSYMSFYGNTLYVGGSGPGNYSFIQDAIENASNDDTIYVYNGIYYENIIIYKSIKLLGENKNNTILDGDKKGDVIRVVADEVTISGFTITNGGRPFFSFKEGGGIRMDPSSYSVISDNIIIDNDFYGILAIEDTSSHNIISGNIISSNGIENDNKRSYFNIALLHSPYNTVSYNIIENSPGIGLSACYWSINTTINNNIIRNNKMGGIRSRHSYSNHIYENIIENNSLFGIRIVNQSADNIISNNDFYNNKPLDAFFAISDPSSKNTWDENYWSRSRIMPKIIPGFLRPNMDSYLGIFWFAVDFHPAKEPFNK